MFTVAVRLWVAAAEDAELRVRLVAVEQRIYANITALAADVAGELGHEPDFDRRLAVAMNTVAGLALTREFDPSGARRRATSGRITGPRSSWRPRCPATHPGPMLRLGRCDYGRNAAPATH